MPNRIQVVERAADILGCFSLERRELGVSEISAQLGLDRATVCRILLTLKQKGFVCGNPSTHKYSIGPKILQLAQLGLGTFDLRDKALPHMRWLRDQIDETIALSIRVGFTRVYLEQLESRQEVKRSIQVGRPYPLHCGSGAKVLMAHMPDEELDEFLATPLVRFTDVTITDPQTLRAEAQQIQKQGYAVGMGERVKGGAGVAAPVRDYNGDVVASLGLVVPIMRFDPQQVPWYVDLVSAAADRISAELGYATRLPGNHQ